MSRRHRFTTELHGWKATISLGIINLSALIALLADKLDSADFKAVLFTTFAYGAGNTAWRRHQATS